VFDKWQPARLSTIPCQLTVNGFKSAELAQFQTFPSAQQLNSLARRFQPDFSYQFLTQEEMDDDDYYENIIAMKKSIPTRLCNWHDFLNGIIWMQFPRTKALISELHCKDINEFGLHPRSARRNRLTHFDECGVVLACAESQLKEVNALLLALATHDWRSAFIKHKELWNTKVFPVVFGHAMLEMFMSPFIGMTAKWLAVCVEDEFFEQNETDKRRSLDSALIKQIEKFEGFADKDVLRPLPVLGVPGWSSNQTEAFYQNQDYFRPQRKGVSLTKQYPLS